MTVEGKLSKEEKRQISLRRALELKEQITDYLNSKRRIPTGFMLWSKIKNNARHIKDYFNVNNKDWKNWHWQEKNRVTEVFVLKELLNLSEREIEEISITGRRFRWAVSPYYLSLMDPDDPNDPIRRQAIPSILECEDQSGEMDPMAEEFTNPAPAITRRYPDRLIVNVTNECASYCRYCQRRRNIGEVDRPTSREDLKAAIKYIKKNEEIRDVLLTGGDALMLSNEALDWILTELDNIPHVEIKRLGTRTLVTLPYRVDDELCQMLQKHLPLYINTQFNHPKEITPASKEACFKLARSGIPLGNQAVLLNGINNDSFIMRKLNQELLKILVRPYYIFHAKAVAGTRHFRTRVEEGIKIMGNLRGYTSGLAIPTYIVNAPKGQGKIPMFPEYLISMGDNKLTIRTWENKILEYENDI